MRAVGGIVRRIIIEVNETANGGAATEGTVLRQSQRAPLPRREHLAGAAKSDGSGVRTDEGIQGHLQRGKSHQQCRDRIRTRGLGDGYLEVDVAVSHDGDHAARTRVQGVAGFSRNVLPARERDAVAHARGVEHSETTTLDQSLRHRARLLVVVENAPLDAQLVTSEEYDIFRELPG